MTVGRLRGIVRILRSRIAENGLTGAMNVRRTIFIRNLISTIRKECMH